MERRGRRKGPDFRRTMWNVEAQLVARSGKQKLSLAFLVGWHALKCGWIEKEEPARINQRKKFRKVQHKCNIKAGIWAIQLFLCKDKGRKNEWRGRELGVRVDLWELSCEGWMEGTLLKGLDQGSWSQGEAWRGPALALGRGLCCLLPPSSEVEATSALHPFHKPPLPLVFSLPIFPASLFLCLSWHREKWEQRDIFIFYYETPRGWNASRCRGISDGHRSLCSSTDSFPASPHITSLIEPFQGQWDGRLTLDSPLQQRFSNSKYTCWSLCLWAASLQLCLALCDPMDCNLPGSSVHGHLQASILGWVANPFSRGSPPPKDWIHVPYVACIGRWVLYH